ncbi:alpha/beta hydrolase [Streptomyces sp. NPDC003077]|uniref:alpha/beta fold hydrolase n=1 Tax=Streptomyces sp. NPDC003077 TaxID=3154443 RepID=UPI00339E17E8
MTEHVSTRDLVIGYEVDGPASGPVVVAVHGWPDDAHCWDGVVPELCSAGCRVYRPYLRGVSPTRFRTAEKQRSGQIGALAHDLSAFLEALDLRNVCLVGHDWGARAGYVLGALFPERLRTLVAMSAGYSTNLGRIPYPLAQAYWYEWFVATELGRTAMDEDRRELCRYLWRTWSPGWAFTDREFEQAAGHWDNADWAPITVHAYLHRWGERPGDPAYEDIERELAASPPVRVPTLVLHGADDRDNAPHTTEGKQDLFAARYERQVLPGIGHFVPRETPHAAAQAILRHASLGFT